MIDDLDNKIRIKEQSKIIPQEIDLNNNNLLQNLLV
jgi:hypothetical protein